MNLQFTDDEFRTLEQAFDTAAPSPKDDPPPVPPDVVLELRYKLLAAPSRLDHAMTLTDDQAEVLSVCFYVGAEMLEPPIALCDAITAKLPGV